MADFPSLTPHHREYTIGQYGADGKGWPTGADQRALFGEAPTFHQLTLRWSAIDPSAIESHYHGQQGETYSFNLPAAVWCGHARYAELATSAITWRYAGPPQFEDESGGIADVTVELVGLAAISRKSTGANVCQNTQGTLVATDPRPKPVTPLGDSIVRLNSGSSPMPGIAAHQAGDLIIVYYANRNNAIEPTPGGAGLTWTTIGSDTNFPTRRLWVYSTIAPSSGTTINSWTNLQIGGIMATAVFSNAAVGGVTAQIPRPPVPNQIILPAVTLQDTTGTSYVSAFVALQSTASGLGTAAPTGMDVTSSLLGLNIDQGATYITEAGVTSFPATNVPLQTGIQSRYYATVEIKQATT